MNRVFRLLLLLLVLGSCQRDLSYVGGPDPAPVLPDPLTANLTGTILDENGQPLTGATVRVGSASATTNSLGSFRINHAALDKKASLVKVERAGYFTGYRVFSATPATNHVVVKMIRRNVAGTVQAATGGEVTVGGGSVTLPANGVVVASSGAPYTGAVSVFAAYIDPTSSDIAQTVPGSFTANDKNGRRVTLASYGMVAVELQGASGEKLQLREGATAVLNFPIPPSLQSSAPSMIALWSVDEGTGIWKEEGMASRQGNNYVGGVRHFSFWNYDIGIPAVQLSMTLKNSDGQPLVHSLVRITRSSNNYSSYGITDTLGRVSGLVPANEALTMTVTGVSCATPIYTQSISPLSQSSDLGVITINTGANTLLTVKGRILNCNNLPVGGGHALVRLGYQTRHVTADASGYFTTNLPYCGTSSRVYVQVADSLASAGPVDSFTVVLPLTNVGDVSACGSALTDYLNYTINGTSYSLSSVFGDSLTAFIIQGSQNLYLSGRRNQQISLDLTASNVVSQGTFPMMNLNVNTLTANGTNMSSTSQVTITQFAPTPQQTYFVGTFSSQFVQQNMTYNVSGSFRIKRWF